MMNRKNRSSKASITVMAMFAIILLGIMGLVVFGGRVFSGANQSRLDNNSQRAGLTYIATKIKNADETGAVSIGQGPEGDMLVLAEPSLGTGYETRIYIYHGKLMEEYSETGSPINTEAAQTITDATSLQIEIEGDLITVDTDEGTCLVDLHSREGASL